MTRSSQSNGKSDCTHVLVPKLLFSAIGFVAFTGVLIAVLRSSLKINFDTAMILSAPLAVLIGFWLGRAFDWKRSATALIVTLVGVAFSATLWQQRYFGMPVMGGADAANHILMQTEFINSDPDAYSGFTVLYGVCGWLEWLGIGTTFQCYRTVIYCIAPMFFAIIGLAATLIFERFSLRVLVFSALLFLTAWFALFPRFHYFQSDGFFGNLLAPIPIGLTWLTWSFGSTWPRRVIFSAAGLILLRFTYGLNLGDLSLTLALVMLLEPTVFLRPALWRPAMFLAFTCLAGICYSILAPVIWQSSGGILPYGVTRDGVAISLLSFILICALPADQNPCVNRSRIFVAIFGLVSSTAALYFRLTTPLPQYYVFKYLYCSAFLVSTVTLLHINYSLADMISTRPLRSFLIAGLFVLSIWMQHRALAPYGRSLNERLSSDFRPRLLQPLLDQSTLTLIQETLALSGKSFGGYITGSWPQSAFLNASMRFPLDLSRYRSANLEQQAGHCIFWNAAPSTLTALRARSAEVAANKVLAWNNDVTSRFSYGANNTRIGYQCY